MHSAYTLEPVPDIHPLGAGTTPTGSRWVSFRNCPRVATRATSCLGQMGTCLSPASTSARSLPAHVLSRARWCQLSKNHRKKKKKKGAVASRPHPRAPFTGDCLECQQRAAARRRRAGRWAQGTPRARFWSWQHALRGQPGLERHPQVRPGRVLPRGGPAHGGPGHGRGLLRGQDLLPGRPFGEDPRDTWWRVCGEGGADPSRGWMHGRCRTRF